MRPRLLALMLTAALVALLIVPAAGASSKSINGTLTYTVKDSGDNGVVRGVYADFKLAGEGFTSDIIDDSKRGGIVVRLYDGSDRTISQVTLRTKALSDPGVGDGTTSLSAPIDSVWGTFDYAADGYWIQPRNLRINGGNCERIFGAEVTIQLIDGNRVIETIEGPLQGSCDDIRR